LSKVAMRCWPDEEGPALRRDAGYKVEDRGLGRPLVPGRQWIGAALVATAEVERNEAEARDSIASDESRTRRSTREKCLIGFMIDFLPTGQLLEADCGVLPSPVDRERTAVAKAMPPQAFPW